MAKPEKLARWMRQQVVAAGARGLLVGLSGGVDSAVVARLAQLATPGGALGVVLSCEGKPDDEHDATVVANHFSLPTVRIELAPAYEILGAELQSALQAISAPMRSTGPADPLRGRVPLANTKPRLRMTALYFLANSLNYLVAGTGNRTELTIGYFTKYGDGGVDLLPLGGLVKSQVRAIARDLGVPAPIIDRPPSAGLWPGQRDEQEMGFSYDELERYLEEGPQSVSPALAMKIERLTRLSEHKRRLPPMPEDVS